MVDKYEQIWDSLRDPEFRKALIDEHINVGIAFQIRAIRESQKLTQVNLAKLLGVKQPLVSSWENADYGKYSLATLKELAKAFDVGLLVRFVSFSELVDKTLNLTDITLSPPSFIEEEKIRLTHNLTNTSDIEATLKDIDAQLKNNVTVEQTPEYKVTEEMIYVA
jgi:transcriptional regulator with XRE-family HTH domain